MMMIAAAPMTATLSFFGVLSEKFNFQYKKHNFSLSIGVPQNHRVMVSLNLIRCCCCCCKYYSGIFNELDNLHYSMKKHEFLSMVRISGELIQFQIDLGYIILTAHSVCRKFQDGRQVPTRFLERVFSSFDRVNKSSLFH
jgi:hypothetical protein